MEIFFWCRISRGFNWFYDEGKGINKVDVKIFELDNYLNVGFVYLVGIVLLVGKTSEC